MVRLTQLDGKMPNLALMKLAAYHRERRDEVVLSRNARRDFFEVPYSHVYGSTIFTRSSPIIEHFKADFPEAVIGGTGLGGSDGWATVEQSLGVERYEQYDYSIYPDFEHSIGFSMRGCRLACGFCVVPRKEGKARSAATLSEIWRGDPYPKNIVLLDNDFFGQPREAWQALLAEAKSGGFRLSFNQGINIRLVRDDETAQAIAAAPYYDDSFKQRRIYTAFDNMGDEKVFRAGVERLLTAGVRPAHIMVYMLTGWDARETWEIMFRRFNVINEYGLDAYPMVYQQVGESKSGNDLPLRELRLFQKWVIKRYYDLLPWSDFLSGKHGGRDLHDEAKALDATGDRIGRKRTRRAELQAEYAQPSLL